MAIALEIRGTVKKPLLGKTTDGSKLLTKISKWFVDHPTVHVEGVPPQPFKNETGEARLDINLHPAAESLELTFDGEHFGGCLPHFLRRTGISPARL